MFFHSVLYSRSVCVNGLAKECKKTGFSSEISVLHNGYKCQKNEYPIKKCGLPSFDINFKCDGQETEDKTRLDIAPVCLLPWFNHEKLKEHNQKLSTLKGEELMHENELECW